MPKAWGRSCPAVPLPCSPAGGPCPSTPCCLQAPGSCQLLWLPSTHSLWSSTTKLAFSSYPQVFFMKSTQKPPTNNPLFPLCQLAATSVLTSALSRMFPIATPPSRADPLRCSRLQGLCSVPFPSALPAAPQHLSVPSWLMKTPMRQVRDDRDPVPIQRAPVTLRRDSLKFAPIQKNRRPFHRSSKLFINVNVELWTPQYSHCPKETRASRPYLLPGHWRAPNMASGHSSVIPVDGSPLFTTALHHEGAIPSPEVKALLGGLEGSSPAHSFQWKSRYHTCSCHAGLHLRAASLLRQLLSGLGSPASSAIPSCGASPVNFAHPFCQPAQITASLCSSLHNLATFQLQWPELSPHWAWMRLGSAWVVLPAERVHGIALQGLGLVSNGGTECLHWRFSRCKKVKIDSFYPGNRPTERRCFSQEVNPALLSHALKP